MKSPVFLIIKDFLAHKNKFKGRCFLKETKSSNEGNKKYYLIKLPKSQDDLKIIGKILQPIDHHVSVYEDQAWSEKNYKSTYHYTGRFAIDDQEIIVHAYFNREGEYCNCHVKYKTNIKIEVNDTDEKIIQSYAEAASIQIISNIQEESNTIAGKFEKEFDEAMQDLCQVSKELAEEKISTLKRYLEQLNNCINKLNIVQQYSYTPRKALHTLLITTQENITHKLKEASTKKLGSNNEVVKNSNFPSEMQNKKASMKLTKKDQASKFALEQTQALEKIQIELDNVAKLDDEVERLIQTYNLYQKKYKLLNPKDIDNILSVFLKINKIRTDIRDELINQAKKGNVQAVKKLAVWVDEIPYNVYFSCIAKGHCKVFNFLLKHYKFNINQIIECHEEEAFLADTPLFAAVRYKQHDMLDLLLQNKANPNIKNHFLGLTPLMQAAMDGSLTLAKLLLKFNADVNAISKRSGIVETTDLAAKALITEHLKNVLGLTALHFVCGDSSPSPKMIKLLLDNGADWRIADKRGWNPFLVIMGHPKNKLFTEAIIPFLEKGAKIDEKLPDNNCTGLLLACGRGNLSEVRFLIEKGADPNNEGVQLKDCIQHFTEEKYGMLALKQTTPFMTVALNNDIEILKYLSLQEYHPVSTKTVQDTYEIAKIIRKQGKVIQFLEKTFDFLSNTYIDLQTPRI